MIIQNNKEYRNIQEQVYFNQQAIEALKIFDVKGKVDTEVNLPVENNCKGDVYLVGKNAPYNFYIYLGEGLNWLNLGFLGSDVEGPVGPQGVPGENGRNTQFLAGKGNPNPYELNVLPGDLYLNTHTGMVSVCVGDEIELSFKNVGSIRGPKGEGTVYTIMGAVDSVDQLPDANRTPSNQAYIVKKTETIYDLYLSTGFCPNRVWMNVGPVNGTGVYVEANPADILPSDPTLSSIKINDTNYNVTDENLAAQVKANTDNIKKNTSDITKLTIDTNNNTGNIEVLTERVDTIDGEVNSFYQDFDVINARLDVAEGNITTNTGKIKNNTDAIAKINDFIQASELVEVEETFDGKGFNIPSTVRVGNNDYSVQDNQKFLLSSATGRTVKSKNLMNLNRTLGEISDKPRQFDFNKFYLGMSITDYTGAFYVKDYKVEPNKVYINSSNIGYGIAFPIKCEPNTTYSINGKYNGGPLTTDTIGYGLYDKNGNFISFNDILTFTTPANCEIINIVCKDKTETGSTYSDIMITKSSSPEKYVPYFDGLKDSRLNVIQSFDTTSGFVNDKTRIKYFEITHKGPTAEYSPGWLAEFSIYSNSDYKLILQYQTVGGGNYYLIGINNKTGQSILQMELTPYTVYNLEEIALEGHTHKNWQLDRYNPLYKHEEIYTNTILTFKAVIDSVGGVDIPLKGVNNIGDEVVAREVGDTGLYDIIKIKRCNTTDLTSWTWVYLGESEKRFYSNSSLDPLPYTKDSNYVPNAIIPKFNIYSTSNLIHDRELIGISIESNGTLRIRDGVSTTPEQIKEVLKGQMLTYELATPVEEVLYTGIPEGAISVLAKQGGFIEFSSPDSAYGADLNRVKMQFKINYWGGN